MPWEPDKQIKHDNDNLHRVLGTYIKSGKVVYIYIYICTKSASTAHYIRQYMYSSLIIPHKCLRASLNLMNT